MVGLDQYSLFPANPFLWNHTLLEGSHTQEIARNERSVSRIYAAVKLYLRFAVFTAIQYNGDTVRWS